MTSNQKFLVKLTSGAFRGNYYVEPGAGITLDRSKAHQYTPQEIQSSPHWSCDKCVLIPVIPFDVTEPQPYQPIED